MILDVIASFILVWTAYQLLIAGVNLFWQEKLPTYGDSENSRRVSVLIPVRNEAANITVLLNDLLKLSCPPAEIIVCDDHSTDETARLVDALANHYPLIRRFYSAPLPPGWTGKNYACHQLAAQASGHYYLFLDADVRLGAHAIERSVSFVKAKKLGLLSIFPRQIMKSWGEKATVPIMNFILLTLLPLILVRKARMFSSISAANGQFMLFNADVYKRILPHKKMYNQVVEDIGIARLFKKEKIRIACLCGENDIRCRMYTGFEEAVNGFAKNIRTFFFNSFIFTLLFWFITTFGFIFIIATCPLPVFAIYLFAVILLRIFVSRASCQSVTDNIRYAGVQQLSFGRIIYKSFTSKFKKQLQWKGRYI